MNDEQYAQLATAVDSYHMAKYDRRPTEVELDCIMLRLRKLTQQQKQELIDSLPHVAIGLDPVCDKLLIVARKESGELFSPHDLN